MAEILGNELLIKALGKKGWREVKHLCVCVQEAAVQSARGNDTTTRGQPLSVALQIHTSRNGTFKHFYTYLGRSDVCVSWANRGIT